MREQRRYSRGKRQTRKLRGNAKVERRKQESRASACGCWNFAEEKVNAAAGTLFLAGELRRTEVRDDGLLSDND
jgi:hypothetical protein